MKIMCQGPYCDTLTDEAETFEAVVPANVPGDGYRIAVHACCLPHLESAAVIAREEAQRRHEDDEEAATIAAVHVPQLRVSVGALNGAVLFSSLVDLAPPGTSGETYRGNTGLRYDGHDLVVQVEREA